MTTGYGQQAAILTRGLLALGHEVTISAFAGLDGAPAAWGGAKILASGIPDDPCGSVLLAEHAKAEKPDIVLTLCDIWALDPAIIGGLPSAHWLPVDCDPLSAADEKCLRVSGAIPVAMSRHGERMLAGAGFDPLYVPHVLNDEYLAWRPPRDKVRERLGLDGLFAIGMNAVNKDPYRKGVPEQFAAFARFHEAHPDTVLLVHSRIAEAKSLDLEVLARKLGITGAVRFSSQPELITGQFPVKWLVGWYTALDLYSGCSLGEGFGLPLIEAQACGTPVVVTGASAMTELAGPGWRVTGEPFWNLVHQAWWCKPHVDAIHDAYEDAYAASRQEVAWAKLRAAAAEFTEPYEARHVIGEVWPAVLDQIVARLGGRAGLIIRGAAPDPHEVQDALWAGWPGGAIAWDVGANTGQCVGLLADRYDQVVAFEPAAEAYEALAAVHGASTTVTALNIAVSDQDGTLTVAEREGPIRTGQLTAVEMPREGDAEGLGWGELTGTREVPCATVDSLIFEHGIPDLIKVDTEGHEGRVLAGAKAVLAEGATGWLIEFHSAALYDDCSRVLRDAGYTATTIRHPHYPPGSRMWHQHGWIRAAAPRPRPQVRSGP